MQNDGSMPHPATIRKAIVTLRTAWNWGARMKIVSGRYPYDGLRYPKSDGRPPFQTRAEIELQPSGLTPDKAAELWESLYLTLPEIERLLVHVDDKATHPWIRPVVANDCNVEAVISLGPDDPVDRRLKVQGFDDAKSPGRRPPLPSLGRRGGNRP